MMNTARAVRDNAAAWASMVISINYGLAEPSAFHVVLQIFWLAFAAFWLWFGIRMER